MARFSPPGNVTDLIDDAHLQAWSDVINNALNGAANEQLVNPLTHPIAGAQPRRVPWFTFPQDVWDRMKRADARLHADRPSSREPDVQGQNEYSEWHTHRDAAGDVVAVDITTEVPEYWEFLAERSPATVVRLYRQYVNAAVVEDDLFTGTGPSRRYNKTNRWNREDGAMHMINGINELPLAVGLIANATRIRKSGTKVMDVQLCESLGSHHADPTVIAHFNRMAREDRFITLADPVGIYIFDIDTMGWETPDGSDPRLLISYNRGRPPVRARVGVQRGCGCGCLPWRRRKPPRFKLSDVTICGERIVSGSQIAERTTVGVIAMVGPKGAVTATDSLPCGPSVAFAAAGMSADAEAPALPLARRRR